MITCMAAARTAGAVWEIRMTLSAVRMCAIALLSAAHVGCGSSTGDAASASSGSGSGAGGPTSGSSGPVGGTGGAAAGSGSSQGASSGAGGNPTSGCTGSGGNPGRPPELTPGTWMNITPSQVSFADTFGANSIDIDPSSPLTLYASLDEQGIWKSTDGGTSWEQLGDPSDIGDGTTGYLDSPIRVAVDPCNSQHLYATQGVRGQTLGFWVSNDGGQTWAWPPGFVQVVDSTTTDVTTLAVDPADFSHVLVGAHSPWEQGDTGILESKDGGQTFTKHAPPGGLPSGSVGIGFGANGNTWLVNGDGGGTWRTENGGDTWTAVSDLEGTHGGAELYRDPTGILYFAGVGSPYRSTNDGVSWVPVNEGLPFAYYLSIVGDGTNLYTAPSFPDAGAMNGLPYFTTAISDGTNWSEHEDGAQTFDNGPYRMRYEPVHGIVYSANWKAGIWAMKPAQ
jgi:hypothetical protein